MIRWREHRVLLVLCMRRIRHNLSAAGMQRLDTFSEDQQELKEGKEIFLVYMKHPL